MADLRAVARRSAHKYGLNADLFERQIGAESGFNPRAVSPAGARGVAQIMPATARGWGVNPDDPEAALDAAAKAMAQYVQTYGNWRDALTAYNAGPGAVGRALPRETRAYITRILGTTGKVPAAVRQPRAARLPRARAAGVDTDAALVDSLLAKRGVGGGLLQAARARVASGAYGLPATQHASAIPDAQRAPRTTGHGRLLELFWQGEGGINAKDGKRVEQGFVSGHKDHVHAAFDTPARAVAMGRLAQRMGLHVGEQSAFGKVHRVHVANSNHYSDRAIDVSGTPAQMRAFAHRVASLFDVR